MNYEPFTSIENPTLAHFRHFSSLFTNLPAYKAADIYVPIRHYICRDSSTNQLLFMQNKPNFKYAQINVNSCMKSKYVKLDTWLSGKNKANSNPIKPNCRKGKIDAKCVLTKDYRKKDDFVVRINKANSNPISVKPKMNVNLYVIEDYENETSFRLQKNKPNQTQFPKGQNELKIACRKIWPHPLLTYSGNCLTSSYFTNIIHRLLIRLLLCRTFK